MFLIIFHIAVFLFLWTSLSVRWCGATRHLYSRLPMHGQPSRWPFMYLNGKFSNVFTLFIFYLDIDVAQACTHRAHQTYILLIWKIIIVGSAPFFIRFISFLSFHHNLHRSLVNWCYPYVGGAALRSSILKKITKQKKEKNEKH